MNLIWGIKGRNSGQPIFDEKICYPTEHTMFDPPAVFPNGLAHPEAQWEFGRNAFPQISESGIAAPYRLELSPRCVSTLVHKI
jgi:hypothetical protein